METSGNYFVTFLGLVLRNIPVALILAAVVIPLFYMRRSAFAVIKRNFNGYFSNPTGYVFLCVFVLLTSLAAFWPHGFFNANLANLDQLNDFLPLIMLIYIPAITMGIWSEERRDGTDELLLTLPAKDFDIVIGKYIAAALIFTVSLLFSQLSNFAVLASLASDASGVHLDTGLLSANYFGYWMIGLAMLSIGMIASFLTNNPTIAFVLGLALNAPLAMLDRVDVIVSSVPLAQEIGAWSMAAHFDDFRRGVLSLSSFSYFAMLIAIGIYASMVLIGRRHWSGGDREWTMWVHYGLRIFLLAVIAAGGTVIFQNRDLVRADVTVGKISSLSQQSRDLIKSLQPEQDIIIRAYIGAEVPKVYVRTRLELISMLNEFAASSDKIQLELFDQLEPFSEEIELAEQRYGIRPQNYRQTKEKVILGVAFQSGLKQVIVPFFNYGVPVEYELARSIATIAQGKRQTIGVVNTDARIEGGFTFVGQQPQQIPRNPFYSELTKQYEVETVALTEKIDPDQYSMLLVVQPSSLGPEQLPFLIAAIQDGVPTAIFEDPLPWFMRWAPGTRDPKMAPGGGMPGMGGPAPQPKCNIEDLWSLLELDVPEEQGAATPPNPMMGMAGMGGSQPMVAWQNDNPYPILQLMNIPRSWVFASVDGLNQENSISSGIKEVFFPMPGTMVHKSTGRMKFTPLAETTKNAGLMRVDEFIQASRTGNEQALDIAQGNIIGASQTIAALIESREESEEETAGETEEETTTTKKQPMRVVYVSDIDVLSPVVFEVRANPEDYQVEDVTWQFENVTFLLNIVDSLAGEKRFIDIRKRKPRHSTLVAVADETAAAITSEYEKRQELRKTQQEAIDKYNADTEEEDASISKEISDLEDQLLKLRDPTNPDGIDVAKIRELSIEIQLKQFRQRSRQIERSRTLTIEQTKNEVETEKEIDKLERVRDQKIGEIHRAYKLKGVLYPPIPPLLIGLFVFFLRRSREREGVASSRLR